METKQGIRFLKRKVIVWWAYKRWPYNNTRLRILLRENRRVNSYLIKQTKIHMEKLK